MNTVLKKSRAVWMFLAVATAFFFSAAPVEARGVKVNVTDDPSSHYFRAAGADFTGYDVAVIDIEEVKTNNDKGVDEVKSAAYQSLETWLRQSGMFKEVKDKTEKYTGKALIIKAKVSVNWGSRAARAFGSFGAGSARINIIYNVYAKGSDKLLAKMDADDATSQNVDARVMVSRAAEKWNKVFIDKILYK
ncbi:MAG: DUF4410 domain-containing protein [Deltaproteobacteria bacterium]|nr:DUF4410 domain-containing protein [Deltaproteobacteria bacterium]